MRVADLGIGVGAFSKGMRNGLQLGNQINETRDRNEIRQIQSEGLEGAREQRQQDIQSRVQPMSLNSPKVGFQSDGQDFSSQQEATEYAEGQVDPTMDYFLRDAAPKIEEAYIGQGRPEKAEAWRSWTQGRRQQKMMKDWANAFQASQMGNFEPAAQYVFDQYNQIDDGVEALDYEPVTENGETTGFNVKLRDSDGTERTEFIDRDRLLNMGLMGLNPEERFEMEYEQLVNARQSEAEAAQEMAQSQREHAQEIELETIKSQLNRAEDQQEFDRDLQTLRDAGYDESFINSVIPSLIGADTPYKKGASPAETTRMLYQERLDNDYSFQRMNEKERWDAVERDLNSLNKIADKAGPSIREGAGGNGGSGGRGNSGANRQGGGRPENDGLMIWDSETGQLVPVR